MISVGPLPALSGTVNLPKTGQTQSYAVGDDGDVEAGLDWPDPRFTNPDKSTPIAGDVVIDQLTGLMWAKNANLSGTKMNWQDALDYVAELDAGGYTDWRLPNVNELESLINCGESNPSGWLQSSGFISIQSYYYWSSNTNTNSPMYAWIVHMKYGYLYVHSKQDLYFVWPVRSGL